jgi:hypothetical protein
VKIILGFLLILVTVSTFSFAKDYKISEETAQKIANYLAQKPYVEVYQLLTDLQKIQEIKEEVK